MSDSLELALTPDVVKAAYHLILGRAPDSEASLEAGVTYHKTVAQMRENLAATPEGLQKMFELMFSHLPHEIITVRSKRGYDVRINIKDIGVSSRIFLFDEFEPHVEQYICSHIDPCKTFIDIGANIGWFTLIAGRKMAQYWSEDKGERGRIISFEANPHTAKVLMSNVLSSPYRDQIDVHPYALSDAADMLYFEDVKRGNIAGSSVHRQKLDNLNADQQAVVDKYADSYEAVGQNFLVRTPCVTLDAMLEEHDQPIGLIKIDVEGSEPSVLNGAKDTLKRFKPDMLVEFHGDKLCLVSDTTPEYLTSQIHDLGYELYDFQAESSLALSKEDVAEIVSHHGYYDFVAKFNS